MCSDSGVHAWTETHTHVHTHLRAQRKMCLTHTEESHMLGSESGMHTQSRLCAQSGVFVNKIHSGVSHRHVHECHTYEGVTHTQSASLTCTEVSHRPGCHIHRGVSHKCNSHAYCSQTHTWGKLCTQLGVAEIHALEDVSHRLGCFIHAGVCHMMSFRQNGFHTHGCVSQIHTVSQTYRGVSHLHRHECLQMHKQCLRHTGSYMRC